MVTVSIMQIYKIIQISKLFFQSKNIVTEIKNYKTSKPTVK